MEIVEMFYALSTYDTFLLNQHMLPFAVDPYGRIVYVVFMQF